MQSLGYVSNYYYYYILIFFTEVNKLLPKENLFLPWINFCVRQFIVKKLFQIWKNGEEKNN